MTFFSRPNLEDVQFRQISGSTLTLEGTTKIVNLNGLELASTGNSTISIAADSNIPITHGMVLGYDSNVGRIRLLDISGGTGSNEYLGASPASIDLGGIHAGTELTGKTVSEILEELLVPATPAAVEAPSATLTTSPTFSSLYEVGRELNVTATMNFDRGSVKPVYDDNGDEISSSGFTSGTATGYTFSGIVNRPNQGSNSSETNSQYSVVPGNNTLTATVYYESGQTVYNSAGVEQLSGLSAGNIVRNRSFNGIYPWFWGGSSSEPTPNQSLIDSGTKEVGNSNGSITVPNYNVSGEYIWFAVPTSSQSKDEWQGGNNPSNNGDIPGGLFSLPTSVSIDSPDGFWSGVNYDIYISNYATSINYSMTFS